MLVSSSGAVAAAVAFFSTTYFSTGKLSPVSEPWMTNRSLACDDPHVAGDHVARGQLDHVAGHELRDGDLLRVAATEHGRRHRDHRLELRGGVAGLGLLDQLQADAQHDHEHHHGRRPGSPVANETAASTASRITSGLSTARQSSFAESRPLVLGQHVRAVLGQARRGLVGGQSLGASLQPRVDARRVQRRRLHHHGRHVDRRALWRSATSTLLGRTADGILAMQTSRTG